MEELKFLSEEEINIMDSLDELYYGGLLSEENERIFEELASRIDKIEGTYETLYGKLEKSQEENGMFECCYNCLKRYYGCRYVKYSDDALIGEYEREEQNTAHNPLSLINLDSIREELDKRGLKRHKNM